MNKGRQAGGEDDALFCHRFRANENRWLSLIAYNLGNLWRRLALPRGDRQLVADQLAAAACEDRRPSY
jgi:hypothetical protein